MMNDNNQLNIQIDEQIVKRKKLLLIMNPKAGIMLAPKYLSEIIQRFSDAGVLTQVLMTAGGGDARNFAAWYGADADLIVVSGGDGTLNGVIDGLMLAGLETPIGYIPAGSTNDFANSIGLPSTIFDCVDTIINGSPVHLDIGDFNGRYFSYVASFGAFTSTSYSVPQNIKNILGHTAYVLGGIRDVLSIKSVHAKVTADKGTPNELIVEGDYVFGAVCNSKSVAGILKLDKLDVDMNDGLMEVLLVRMPKDPIALNDIVVNMLGGTLASNQIEFFSAKDIDVEIDPGTHWTLDGEYEEGRDVCNITTVRSAITLIK
ncbi:MAG: YegS/Rv2252/BmrU family lipid kinase [Mogibacterium sp.]|nr:YegS/Rv2252/BmrU family lipid kinase [Mogibacterium sp.]